MNVLSNKIGGFIVPLTHMMIGGHNNPNTNRMNDKLIQNALRQLLENDVRTNYILQDRCAHEVRNYFRVKTFVAHPPVVAASNQDSKSTAAITYSTCEIGLQFWDQINRALNGAEMRAHSLQCHLCQ